MDNPSTPVLIPHQSARLKVGDREIAVPDGAISSNSKQRRTEQFSVDEEQRHLITASDGYPLGAIFGAALFLIGGLVTAGFGVNNFEGSGRVLMCILGLALLAISCLFVRHVFWGTRPARFVFDVASETLVIDCKHGLKRSYQVESTHSLDIVLGIQLLHSGYYSMSSSSGTSSQFHAYEMNLVLDDSDQPRMYVCTHSDWEWMREVGEKLSSYIGIPLIDQLYHGA